MGRKGLSAALVVTGLGLVAFSLVADAVGLGGGSYVFGWEQKLGVAVGMTVAWFAGLRLLGWYPLAERAPKRASEAPSAAPVSV